MRNRRLIEELIPVAIDQIESGGIATEHQVPKAFNGYIASFATSIVQAGLRQSVLFFSNSDANTKEGRDKITELIFNVLMKSEKIEDGHTSLNDYVLAAPNQAKGNILDAAVACKIAIRSFKLV